MDGMHNSIFLFVLFYGGKIMRKIFITSNHNDTIIVKKFLLDNSSIFDEYIINDNHVFEVDDIYYNDLLLRQHIYFKQFKNNIKYFDYEENILPSGYTTIGRFKINDAYVNKIESIIILLKKWFMYYDIKLVLNNDNTYTLMIDNFDEGANKVDFKEFINVLSRFGLEFFDKPEDQLKKTYTYKKLKK